jgi:hypothetical protein
MNEETLRRAIRVCIQAAHSAGRLTKGSSDSLQTSLDYAYGVIVPTVEAMVEQGIEDAWQAHLKSVSDQAEQKS